MEDEWGHSGKRKEQEMGFQIERMKQGTKMHGEDKWYADWAEMVIEVGIKSRKGSCL